MSVAIRMIENRLEMLKEDIASREESIKWHRDKMDNHARHLERKEQEQEELEEALKALRSM